jgi:hypothetical protein
MSKQLSLFALLSLSIFLSACASTKSFYYKDGTEVHVVQCTGSSWIGCFEKASLICKTSGYDVLERNAAKTSGFFNTTDNKELIIRCKPEAAPMIVPAAPAIVPTAPVTTPAAALAPVNPIIVSPPATPPAVASDATQATDSKVSPKEGTDSSPTKPEEAK